MICRVLLFAQVAEAVGAGELELELADGATVATALDELARAHPIIAELRGHLALAVDETYVPADHTLVEGATLAIISPVSGG